MQKLGLTPHNFLYPHRFSSSRSQLYLQNHINSLIPTCKFSYGGELSLLLLFPQGFSTPFLRNFNSRRHRGYTFLRASSKKESPYQVLGVSPSATPDEIKRAYRRLALKFHPDVNKEKNAQEKFMRIKHAYNTLLNSESRKKYDAGKSSGFSYSGSQSQYNNTEEEFYGFGFFMRDVQITLEDFFRDLQEEFRNWEASASSQGKPKSLWEELAEIGEEFVEFLEKELNITDAEVEGNKYEGSQKDSSFYSSDTGYGAQKKEKKGNTIEDNIEEIEATLAKLKKELGL